MVQHGSEIPEGQAAVGGRAAQEQPPGGRARAAGSVREMGSNRSPHPAHAGPPGGPSHRRWLGASWVKEWTLRTHRLWWKVSARSCSRRPESCKRKSLGGGEGGASSEPILDKLPALVSGPKALRSHRTAPSLQAAATRGPRPGRSSSHTARDMYLQTRHRPAVRGSLGAAARGQPCGTAAHAPASRCAHHLVSGSTLTIRCRLRCRSQYSSSRWDERCMTWQARRLGVLGSGVTMMLKQCISARPPADTT